MRVPSEFAIGGVYMPPLLVAAVLGITLAVVTASWLNRRRLSRHFFAHPPVLIARERCQQRFGAICMLRYSYAYFSIFILSQ